MTTSSVPDATLQTNPTLVSYPVSVVAIAPYYNLPSSIVGSAPLTLSSSVICRMWRLNITYWNDTSITSTNPLLTLPGQPIQMVQLDFANDASLAASRLCTKIDPGWAAQYGVTSWPPIGGNIAKITLAQGMIHGWQALRCVPRSSH